MHNENATTGEDSENTGAEGNSAVQNQALPVPPLARTQVPLPSCTINDAGQVESITITNAGPPFPRPSAYQAGHVQAIHNTIAAERRESLETIASIGQAHYDSDDMQAMIQANAEPPSPDDLATFDLRLCPEHANRASPPGFQDAGKPTVIFELDPYCSECRKYQEQPRR